MSRSECPIYFDWAASGCGQAFENLVDDGGNLFGLHGTRDRALTDFAEPSRLAIPVINTSADTILRSHGKQIQAGGAIALFGGRLRAAPDSIISNSLRAARERRR